MPRLDSGTWEDIRAAWEIGESLSALSERFGVDKAAISRRAKKQGWIKDVSGAVSRAVEAKVNGVVNAVDPQKRAQAIDAAASQVAAVVTRHREEWDGIEAIRQQAVSTQDFDAAKLAKISAETLMIKQTGERKAWGLDKPEGATVNVNVGTKEQRDAAVRAAADS